MRTKKVFELILIIIFFAGVGGAASYFLLLGEENNDKAVAVLRDPLFGWKFPENLPSTTESPTPIRPGTNLFDFEIAWSSIRDPGGTPQGLPVRLKIPIIGVSSAVEDALITPDGRMDVPAGSENVAWFSLGPKPGKVGSAVIGGHFGIRNGIKFVFYDLDKLKVGDRIYIEDDRGDTLAFQVRKIQLFDRNADATPVFTSNDGLAHLNVITCEGIWNKVEDSYPSRRVVFTDAIPSEGAVVVNPLAPVIIPVPVITKPVVPSITAFYRSVLRIGTRGTDVVALQTALQQKGFLAVSSGALDGIFGGATRAAVAKFQASAGLSPDGVFGPMTKAKLVSELAHAAVQPTLPTTAMTTPGTTTSGVATTSSSSKNFTTTVKSLYDTPIDGLITSILIIAIVFVAFKIIL